MPRALAQALQRVTVLQWAGQACCNWYAHLLHAAVNYLIKSVPWDESRYALVRRVPAPSSTGTDLGQPGTRVESRRHVNGRPGFLRKIPGNLGWARSTTCFGRRGGEIAWPSADWLADPQSHADWLRGSSGATTVLGIGIHINVTQSS